MDVVVGAEVGDGVVVGVEVEDDVEIPSASMFPTSKDSEVEEVVEVWTGEAVGTAAVVVYSIGNA